MTPPRSVALAVMAVACFLASEGGAQVYSWTDSQGKVHYGDRPPDAAKAKPVDTAKTDTATTGSGSADVHVMPTEIDWFSVRGLTRADIRATMRETAPFSEQRQTRVWGQCAWRVTWKFEHRREGGECRVDRMRLEVHARMKLPRWEDEAVAPAELRAQWQEFSRRLRVHEDGHRNTGIAAARDLARRLRALPAYPDCDALNRDIARIGERVIGEHRQLDDAFDRVDYLYITGF